MSRARIVFFLLGCIALVAALAFLRGSNERIKLAAERNAIDEELETFLESRIEDVPAEVIAKGPYHAVQWLSQNTPAESWDQYTDKAARAAEIAEQLRSPASTAADRRARAAQLRDRLYAELPEEQAKRVDYRLGLSFTAATGEVRLRPKKDRGVRAGWAGSEEPAASGTAREEEQPPRPHLVSGYRLEGHQDLRHFPAPGAEIWSTPAIQDRCRSHPVVEFRWSSEYDGPTLMASYGRESERCVLRLVEQPSLEEMVGPQAAGAFNRSVAEAAEQALGR